MTYEEYYGNAYSKLIETEKSLCAKAEKIKSEDAGGEDLR